MSGDLTRFSDGVGYLEHAENGLSPAQRQTLLDAATGLPGRGRSTTVRVLQGRDLLDARRALTARGRELVEFIGGDR